MSQQFTVGNDSDLNDLMLLIRDCLEQFGGVEVKVSKKGFAASQSMKGTWRMWMRETAKAMAARDVRMDVVNAKGQVIGSRPINENDAHELFMYQWGGVDATGERCHQEDRDNKGLMLHIMDKHVQFCVERGIKLTIPRDGEYMKLQNEAA